MNRSFLWYASLVLALAVAGCESQPYPQGERLFTYYCANCHMTDGSGLGTLYPAIAGSDFLGNRKQDLPCLIRNGQAGKILKTVVMPANPALTEAEMYNLVNYIHFTWGERQTIDLPIIRRQLENCQNE